MSVKDYILHLETELAGIIHQEGEAVANANAIVGAKRALVHAIEKAKELLGFEPETAPEVAAVEVAPAEVETPHVEVVAETTETPETETQAEVSA